MFYWNPWAAAIMVAIAVEFAFAAWVFFAQPARVQNRRLAAFLLVEGFAFVGGTGLLYVTTDVGVAHGAQMMTVVALILMLIMYARLLATLDTPLAAPLRSPWIQGALVAFAVAGSIVAVVQSERFVLGYISTWYSRVEAAPTGTFIALNLLTAIVAVYSLAVAVSAWRRAPTRSAARRTTAAFALAFAWRDVGFAIVQVALVLSVVVPQSPRWLIVLYLVTAPVSLLGFVLLSAYGILRNQLFGIDLRLKWTIKRGTVAGIILASFFIVTVVAENFLTDRYGWAVGGGVAGLLLFAIAPLQRLGERLANVALPNVQDTAAYRDNRAKELYAAAWEAAMKDGAVSEKERDVLATLQEKLDLRPTEALAIERGMA